MSETMQISDADLDRMAAEVSNTIQQEVQSDQLLPKLEKLKITASEFNQQYLSLSNRINDAINSYQNIEALGTGFTPSGNDAADNQVIQNYNDALKRAQNAAIQQIGQELYTAVINFQYALNDFFNQSMELTLVIGHGGRAGRTDVYVDAEMHNYAEYLTYELRDGKIQARFTNLAKLAQDLNMTEWSKPEFLTDHSYDLNAVSHLQYSKNSTMRRYTISRTIINKYNADQDKKAKEGKGGGQKISGQGLVLWHRPEWTGHVWVRNRGVINEAYATALMDRQEFRVGLVNGPFASSNIEDLLDVFIYRYVMQVDTAPGVLHGDTSDADAGIEYAIKSSRAAALGYEQLEDYAKIVLAADFSPAKIAEWADKGIKGATKLAMEADLSTLPKEIYDDIISGVSKIKT